MHVHAGLADAHQQVHSWQSNRGVLYLVHNHGGLSF